MIEYGTSDYKRISWALVLASFCVFCNLYLFQPILPALALEFQVSESQINWVFASATLVMAVSLLPFAIWSEGKHQGKLLLLALSALPLLTLPLLIFDSYMLIVALRALIGLSIACFVAVAVPFLAQSLSSHAFTLAMGSYIAANSLGGIIGRLTGGIITQWFGWQHAVIVIMIMSLLCVTMVYRLLKPLLWPCTKRNENPESTESAHSLNLRVCDTTGSRSNNRSLTLKQRINFSFDHLSTPKLWFAMVIGGINFALFVNLFSVMGFRLTSAPYHLPTSLTSMIFLCYLGGTLSSKLAAKWLNHHGYAKGMFLGGCISFLGTILTYFENLHSMLLGLLLVGFGAFFVHTLAYGWVSLKAKQAKATATSLYLMHYYAGGSLGGFFLLDCWQRVGWNGVILGASSLFILLFISMFLLTRFSKRTEMEGNDLESSATADI